MKLTSVARLRLVTLAITTILTASIGSFITFQSYNTAIHSIDLAINGTIDDAKKSPSQELSAALFHIEEFSLDLSLYLVTQDGSITTVNSSTTELFQEIPLAQVKSAINGIHSGVGKSDYRFRSLPLAGGDYLVVAAASHLALVDLESNSITVLLATVFTSIFAFTLVTLYTRRLKRRDDADALMRMQSFLGDASHELRTPLTVIKGYVEMLSKGQLKEESDRERAFSRVTNEITRMESLIHDLLLLAELGESAQRENESVDISALTEGYVKDFVTLNPYRSIEVNIESEVSVVIVRDHFVRFIQNALNNISRHTPIDAPIRISISQVGKNARIAIEDGGPGLPKDAYKEKVQSLTRFDKSRSRESGGSGLGMSIMAAVITKAGGDLTLRQSDLGGLALIAQIPIHRE